jgi:hypothetical protein
LVSPSPSAQPSLLKAEDGARMSPAIPPQVPTAAAAAAVSTPSQPPVAGVVPLPQQPAVAPVPVIAVEPKRLRAPGKGIKDALISQLRIQAHPSIHAEPSLLAEVLPHRKEMQQCATVNVPPTHTRVLIVLTLPDFLYDRQYNLWTLMNKQPLQMSHHQLPKQSPYERVFDVLLHPGVNVVEAHLVAAIPRGERVPGGSEVEVEVLTAYLNVMRP